MREIKFRAWNASERKMTTPFAWVNESNLLSTCMCSAPTHELMQFTGMHDKNGVPIFEGDIVSGYVHFPEVNYIVCYNSSDYSCGFKCKQSDGAGVIDVWYKGLTVIGNIHQHAHLLEQNKC